MTVQTPSIGRIVLFRSLESNQQSEHPAMITRVWSDTCVNLIVFPDAGVPVVKTSATLNENIDDTTSSYSWRWPPRVDVSRHGSNHTPEKNQA